jgi:uncharacterized protein (DUF1800 family)
MKKAIFDPGTSPKTSQTVLGAGAALASAAAAIAGVVSNSKTSTATSAVNTTAPSGVGASATKEASGNSFSQIWNGSANQPAPTAPRSTQMGTDKLPSTISDVEAVRFLIQATPGFTPEDIKAVRAMGYARWIDEQMAIPSDASNQVAPFYWANCARRYKGNPYGPGSGDAFQTKFQDAHSDLERALWWRLISPRDTLRQRVALALSEICVVATGSLKDVGCYWPYLASAKYFDLLADHAFGNYRNLLQKLPFNPAMATFLNVVGSKKATPGSPALPDENFAREFMQLFTIGTVMLKPDGTEILQTSPIPVPGPNGTNVFVKEPVPTYGMEDVRQLARIFTGIKYPWDIHQQDHSSPSAMPPWQQRPLPVDIQAHDTGTCTFLGKTVASSQTPALRIRQAIDIVFGHPNVAPYISKQLIQRLVISNPTSAYVTRVARVFENDGTGVKGNLAAVVKAILLDPEARMPNTAIQRRMDYGKVREPMLRFTHWARMFKARSPQNFWITHGDAGMGASPMYATSVFNFFQPDYVPDHPSMANRPVPLVAPELQIANAQTVIAYLNKMFWHVDQMGVGDMRVSYDALGVNLPANQASIADNANELVTTLSLWLTGGEFKAWAASTIGAIHRMPKGTPENRLKRVKAAIFMTVASPDYIVQK